MQGTVGAGMCCGESEMAAAERVKNILKIAQPEPEPAASASPGAWIYSRKRPALSTAIACSLACYSLSSPDPQSKQWL